MFDKITIRAKVSEAECGHFSDVYNLNKGMNRNGEIVRYYRGDISHFDGVNIDIRLRKQKKSSYYELKLSTSLHKYWEKRNFGELRNDTLFTVSAAKAIFSDFLFNNGLVAARVKITYFEIGLNLPVNYDPLSFIELVQYGFFLGRKKKYREKTMFVDVNYRINRQKTTEKHRDMRKYYKIYDKSWEMAEKKRPRPVVGAPVASGTSDVVSGDAEGFVLRVETVYKRQNESADSFFSDENVERLTKQFFLDWKGLSFYREVKAQKGTRKSEVERARKLINIGAEEYLKAIKCDLDQKKITAKQYRTIREFIRDFKKNELRFVTVISPQENEYNRVIMSQFVQTKR
ncbi:MAG: hypothetical protein LBH80_07040 [Prevotellaceae bacterium]|jgi:hypothetical protein|nr:hypothetical protein [Prevotellaceae bacterium]